MTDGLAGAFLLAFPALFSIVNPVAGAFIFREATADRTHAQRVALARRVGLYALLVMLVALGAGSYLLAAFGITLAALRIAGGLVLALFAWDLLQAPEKREATKQQQAEAAENADDIAFFPLTLPMTTGPGTIAVSVALGAGRPETGAWAFFAGTALAAAALALVITALYAASDRLSDVLGRNGRRTVTRLSAFLLFCIGVQLLITGVVDVLTPLLASTALPHPTPASSTPASPTTPSPTLAPPR